MELATTSWENEEDWELWVRLHAQEARLDSDQAEGGQGEDFAEAERTVAERD